MRKVALITSVVLLAVVFIACKQTKGPEAIVEKYYTHFYRAEFKEVKEYVMEEHRSYYDLMESLVASQGNTEEKPEVKVTDIKCEIQDDVATCTCNVQAGEEVQAQTLSLKKVNNKWLVNQGKEGGFGGESDDSGEEEAEEAEEMAEVEPIIM